MAEFKLGRIKFVWRGEWDSTTDYVVDDVINNAGQTYICVRTHTSGANFATDFDALPTKWELVSDGQRWRGDWTPTTYYEKGDIAKFGGIVYICTIPHTSDTYVAPTWSGIEPSLGLDGSTVSKWDVFAESTEWVSAWAPATRYRKNDVVSYGGAVYICNTPHISDTDPNVGLEISIFKWDVFNQGITYLGEWSGLSVRYKLNDLVKYGADVWICTIPHNSTTLFNQANWSVFVSGFEFENSWNSSTIYQIGDLVTYGGYSYIAKTNNTNAQPTSSLTDWDVFTTGFNFQGDWNVATNYKVGDLVRVNSWTYVAVLDNVGYLPPNVTYWNRLNSGLQWTNSTQTYTNVSGTNLIGTGLNASFDVTRTKTVYSVTVDTQGTGYNANDEIKILGTSLGGLSPANDLVITVVNQSGGAIGTSPGDITWAGYSSNWKSGVDYILGDVVFLGANSYVCILNHTSGLVNRPDADTAGSYWNVLAAGAEQAVLTTEGDTFFFGPSGATRLPAGEEGQILRVTNGYPEWMTYGLINNIVYVGPNGVDLPNPDYGLTIDKPWKTVRYACESIEAGYLNRQAAELLAKNKQFIIKEVYEYVENTYPSIVDQAKTERDAGIVLDALVFDISHGGSLKTVTAAREYLNAEGDDYVNATVEAQKTEFIAGLNYLISVSTDVLNNAVPDDNYQTLNSVADPASQIIDISLEAEAGTIDKVEELVGIVTDTLTAGNLTVIPVSINPVTTVSVKTGTFNEVLPIVIPNYTAIVGDELRSTVIQPKTAIDLLNNDKPKTVAVLQHLQSLISDLMSNTSITPTVGNNETQVVSLDAASAGNVTADESIATNIALIRGIFENGRQEEVSFTLPNPTNFNTTLVNVAYASTGNLTGNTANYGDGIAQIVQNYQFIKDEIAAWLIVNGTWNSYSAANKAKTLRDLSFALDSLQYDMRYGGNRQALIHGRAYYSNNIIQLNAPFLTETLGALGRLKTIITQIVQGALVTPTAGNTTVQITSGTAGSAGAGAFAQARVQDIVDWINNGDGNAEVDSYKGHVSATLLSAYTNLQAKKSEIQYDALLWVKKFYQATAFNFDLTERDAGDIVNSISLDLIYGSNFNSLIAGRRYRSPITSVEVLINDIPAETTGAINFIGHKSKLIAASGATAQASMIIDDAIAQVRSTVSTTLTIATTSTNLLTVTSTASMFVNMPVRITGLPANTTASATATAVTTNLITLSDTVTNLGIAVNMPIWFSNGVFGRIIDDKKYYVKTASGSTITISETIGGATVALVTATGTMNVTINKAGGLVNNRTYWVRSVDSTTTLTLTATYKSATAVAIGNTTNSMTATIVVGELAETNGTNDYNNDLGTIRGAEILRANKEFLAYESTAYTSSTYNASVTITTASNNRYTTSAAHPFTAGDPVVFSGTIITNSGITAGVTYWILAVPTTDTFTLTDELGGTTPIDITVNGTGSMTVQYSYSQDSCRRDAREFVEAFIDDLNFTGNYKSLRAAIQYVHAVDGSEMANMFYVGNATGLRNCTLSGLTGTLTPPNAYGTKRPTAGAYTSLNPGFGPADENVWVQTRSHYSQNVTMFGTACTGAKIDSALHAGGNKSMVKNDYTTILSDGIGVWCTGSDSLVELVSVFNYYGYAGYIAELGGRIRATNGNSSYGTYGVIAEGVDSYEVPLFATLDSQANDAVVGVTLTDGLNEVLRFEYTNAGTQYTNYVPTISGAGFNAAATGDEFRDSGCFEVRLIDLDDGDGFGGADYITASNVSQLGDPVSITLAATDTALSTAYVGMRVLLTGGTGAGQFAGILTYSNGSKVAKVYKESFTTLTVTATAITNNLLTVASTATLYVGMPIYLGTGATNGVTANTLYYIIAANFSATQFAVSTAEGGSAETITTNASGLTIPLYAAGWDHAVPGRDIETILDLTTGYIVEPRLTFTDPGFRSTARSLSQTTTWGDIDYSDGYYLAITNNGTATTRSANGTSWASGGALPASTTWADVVYGGGEGATAVAIIGGLGGDGAVLTAVLGEANINGDPLADQVASVTVVDGGFGYTTPPTIVFGGPGSGAVATATVLNGVIQEVTVSIPGSGYVTAPTVTAATDRLSSIEVITSGRNYTTTNTTVSITGGGGSSATVEAWGVGTGDSQITNGGVYQLIVDNPGSGYTSTPTVTILDTNAKWVAIRTTGGAAAAYNSTANIISSAAWTSSSSNQPAGTYAALTYGNGIYVGVGGTNTAMSSTDGNTWVSRTITTASAGTWSDIVYGNGYFIAINTGGNQTSRSTNGISWSAGGNLPSSTTWTKIAYGNGRFVAVASGGRSVAYSLDRGATWDAVTPGLPSSQTWTSLTYGQGLFMAVASGTTVAATSPDGINWTTRTMSASTTWSDITFGNTSGNPLFVAISSTSGTIASSIETGCRTEARAKVVDNQIEGIRIVDPGSGYPKGSITATTASTNILTTSKTSNLINNQPIEFTGLDDYGLETGVTYYVIGSTIVTDTSYKVSAVSGSTTPVTLTTATGLTATYRAGPILTQTDPNRTVTAPTRVRMGDGILATPSFSDRGTANTTAETVILGDGYADFYQVGVFVNVKNVYQLPLAGANIEFASIPGEYFTLVSVTNVLGIPGNYTASFQLNPPLTVLNAPNHEDLITTKLKYSQVRLTGHDFLYIGTGNFADTNYPNVDTSTAITANQTKSSNGGRCFFTSTDQDGNFNVGNLFGVQQSTGTATLNASAFNLSGLQSLQLGSLGVGTGSAIITQFSTDPFFTANSDEIVPTQRAIKSYITSQIGGGQSSLNVNTLTAGIVFIANNSISTTTGEQINVKAKMYFTGGVDGAPVALTFFSQR
jgi:hypothetical protein